MDESLGTMELLKEVSNSAAGRKKVPGRAFQGRFYLSFNLKKE